MSESFQQLQQSMSEIIPAIATRMYKEISEGPWEVCQRMIRLWTQMASPEQMKAVHANLTALLAERPQRNLAKPLGASVGLPRRM